MASLERTQFQLFLGVNVFLQGLNFVFYNQSQI